LTLEAKKVEFGTDRYILQKDALYGRTLSDRKIQTYPAWLDTASRVLPDLRHLVRRNSRRHARGGLGTAPGGASQHLAFRRMPVPHQRLATSTAMREIWRRWPSSIMTNWGKPNDHQARLPNHPRNSVPQKNRPGEAAALKQRSPDDEAAFQAQVSSTRPERKQNTNGSDRTPVTCTQPAPRPSRDGAVIKIDKTLDERAKTPEEALSMRADKLALGPELDKQRAAVAKGRNPFTGSYGEMARRAYDDFLSARGMADTPDSRRVFFDLLS